MDNYCLVLVIYIIVNLQHRWKPEFQGWSLAIFLVLMMVRWEIPIKYQGLKTCWAFCFVLSSTWELLLMQEKFHLRSLIGSNILNCCNYASWMSYPACLVTSQLFLCKFETVEYLKSRQAFVFWAGDGEREKRGGRERREIGVFWEQKGLSLDQSKNPVTNKYGWKDQVVNRE